MDKRTCSIAECEKPARSNDNVCSMHRARITRHGSPDGKATRKSVLQRVAERVVTSGDDACWEWLGAVDHQGYAKLRTRTQNIRVHRYLFEHFNGPVGDDFYVDHVCHNRACVRPEHLRAATPKQNVENFATALRSHNTSGYRGVSFHKHSGLWHARVKHAGHVYSGGYYRKPEDAGEAARALRLALHTHNDLDSLGD